MMGEMGWDHRWTNRISRMDLLCTYQFAAAAAAQSCGKRKGDREQLNQNKQKAQKSRGVCKKKQGRSSRTACMM